MRRRLVVVALLLALLATPSALAVHEGRSPDRDRLPAGSGPQLVVEIALDRTAVTPPANVSGEVRFTGNAPDRLAVDATVRLSPPHGLAERQGEAEQGSSRPAALASFQLDLDPGETVTRSLTLPVTGVGTWRLHVEAVSRHGGDPVSSHLDPPELVGLAPVEVIPVEAPDGALVSLPEEPATYTVRLRAREGANLSELRLSARDVGEPVDIGNLDPGSSTEVTLEVRSEEHTPRRSGGIDKTVLLPRLSGQLDGVGFQHPLHLTTREEPERVHPPVYVAISTDVALIPPASAELGSPTWMDVVLANTEATSVEITSTVHMELEGLPSLSTKRDLQLQAASGEVTLATINWTPPAAGQWELVARHELSRYPANDELHVSGPIQRAEVDLPNRRIERGETIEPTVRLTADEATTVDGLSLTTWSAPKDGTISTRDILRLDGPDTLELSATQPTEATLQLTALASGSYDLFLVVDTDDGPSVHQLPHVTVGTSAGGWGLAMVPTGVLLASLVLHGVWRARWVD